MKYITISHALAEDLINLLQCTIEYDTQGEPIDSDHAQWLDDLIDLEYLIKHSK